MNSILSNIFKAKSYPENKDRKTTDIRIILIYLQTPNDLFFCLLGERRLFKLAGLIIQLTAIPVDRRPFWFRG